MRVSDVVVCWIVFFRFMSEVGGGSVQNYKKWHFFIVFSSLGTFPQVFKQIEGWIMSELQKVLHVVASPIVFILFYEEGWQGGSFFSVISRLGPLLQVFR